MDSTTNYIDLAFLADSPGYGGRLRNLFIPGIQIIMKNSANSATTKLRNRENYGQRDDTLIKDVLTFLSIIQHFNKPLGLLGLLDLLALQPLSMLQSLSFKFGKLTPRKKNQ